MKSEQSHQSDWEGRASPTSPSIISFLLAITLFVLVTLKTDLPESTAREMGRAIHHLTLESSEILSALSIDWDDFYYEVLRLR